MISNINRKSKLYKCNKLSEPNSNSANNNKSELDGFVMEYKRECNKCECANMKDNNINSECDILRDHITVMWSRKIYKRWSICMSELCIRK